MQDRRRELRRERRLQPSSGSGETRTESRVEMLDALKALPPPQRAALFLHYYADLPIAEIARRQGTTSAAVKVRLMRGRHRLSGLGGL